MRTILTLLLYACSPQPEEAPPAPAATGPAPPEEGAAEEDEEQAEGPRVEAGDTRAHASGRVAARHILVSYAGALQAKGVSRDRDAALALARELRGRLLAGEDFAALARQYSGDPGTARRGGVLGAFGAGEMTRAFEDGAFALREGELSEPVETPYGFHLIERMPLVEERLAHLLVQWAGIPHAKATRGREEALALAQQAQARVLAGEPFATVAAELSDGPAGPWGGELGWMVKGQLSPKLDAVAFALERGEVSEVVESSLGFHLLYRLE